MTDCVHLLPNIDELSLIELHQRVIDLEEKRQTLRPFHPELLEFCETFARAIRENQETRSNPALVALAWWLRRSSLKRIHDHWIDSLSPSTIRVPRGIVFHVPPTNVETIIIYSWICSALAGNANIIRVSSSSSSENTPLFEVLFETLEKYPTVSKTTLFIKYGHSDDVTEILSQTDTRVIWGGDSTVEQIRNVRSSPRSIDIPFSNRFSFCLIEASSIKRASDTELKTLAQNFVNDAYWFDQLACSSPKLIFLLDTKNEQDDSILPRLIHYLSEELIRKNVEISPSTSMAKMVNSFALAADGVVSKIIRPNHQITLGEVAEINEFPRDLRGGGLFCTARITKLEQLLPFINRTDQTVTYYGVSKEDLYSFAVLLNGRGIDRIVPVGEALNFDFIWDGYDLLTTLSKLVHLK